MLRFCLRLHQRARTVRCWLGILMGICLLAQGTHAMRTPEEYRAARVAATHWIQFRVQASKPAATVPGICVLRGEITRYFKGVPFGASTIDLEVECKPRAQRSPAGDEFRLDAEDLRPGQYLEAFVTAEAGRYRVVARQVHIVAAPGEKPTFTGKA